MAAVRSGGGGESVSYKEGRAAGRAGREEGRVERAGERATDARFYASPARALPRSDHSATRSPRHRRAVSPPPVRPRPASAMRTPGLQHLARRPLSTSAVSRHENPLVRVPLVSLHCPRSRCPGPSSAQCSTPASDAPQRRRATPKAVHPARRRRPRRRQRQGRRRQEHRSRSARPSPSAPGATSLTRAAAQ